MYINIDERADEDSKTIYNNKIIDNYTRFTEPISVTSNGVTTIPYSPNFTVTKEATVNNEGIPSEVIYAVVGDTINYIVTVTNHGNITLTAGLLNDSLSEGLQLDANSVTVNGRSIFVTGNTLSDIPLGELPVSTSSKPSTTIIKFNAIVMRATKHISNISNIATISYEGPGHVTNFVPIIRSSNTIIINAQQEADYSVVKEVRINNQGSYEVNARANLGDIVSYRITITNTGRVAFLKGVLNDTLNNNLTIVSNSITVNGSSRTAMDNNLVNIDLPILPVGGAQNPGRAVILFDAIITGTGDTIPNTVGISYDPVGPQKPINKTSAPATIRVNQPQTNPNFTAVKEVRTNGVGNYAANTIANEGDTVNYRITITNTGNVDFNLEGALTDILDNNLELDGSSVFIGNTNVWVIGNDLNSITLPPLGVASSIIVTFNATVLSSEINISNQSTAITYNYTGQTVATTRSSTIANVNTDILNITKTVCPEYVTIGTILTYTVVLTNNSSQQLNDIVFNDILDSDLTLVPGSIYINNVLQPMETTLNNLNLPCLPVATPRAHNTITFSVGVTGTGPVVTSQGIASYLICTEQETRTAISNIVNTTISIPCIAVAKSVNLCDAMITDIIRYTIVITNRGNVEITNLTLADKLDKRLEVVPESIRINGSQPLSEKVDIRKLSLPNLLPPTGSQTMTTLTVTFDAVVKDIDWYMDPSSMGFQETNRDFTVHGKSTIAYGFVGETAGVLRTNRVSTNIIIPNPCLNAVKLVSSECARVGDILTYTVILNNTGNVPLTGIVLSDTVPSNLTIDPLTIKINGIPVPRATANTLSNLQIPNMQVPQVEGLQPVVVTFEATVGSISSNTTSNRRPRIQNMATVTYNYVGSSSVPMTTSTNIVTTRITNNSSEYEVFVPINLSPSDPLVDAISQITPKVISISPSSQKYNIIVNVLYSIVLSYRSVDGNLTTITKHYKVDIPNPNYTINTKVTVNSIETPIIIKGHQVNIKLRFDITN